MHAKFSLISSGDNQGVANWWPLIFASMRKTRRKQLVECNSSKTTRRMQLVENNSLKLEGGKLVEN